VLGVELEAALNGGIANHIAVGEILGENAGTGLLLLRNLVGVTLGILGIVGAVVLSIASRSQDGNLVGTELGVIQEESRLGSGFLLKGDVRGLGLALGGDLDVGNLATEAEEVLDLAVAGRASNVGDVHSGHGECQTWGNLEEEGISF